jgi:hypothetical protein
MSFIIESEQHMAILQPLTELNEAIRAKATKTILELEKYGELGDSTLIWNNLFFRHPDGTYYATFHDIADDDGYPYWLRSNQGVMEIKLWWVDGEILATGASDEEEAKLGDGDRLIDSGNRSWRRTGPTMIEPSALPDQVSIVPAKRSVTPIAGTGMKLTPSRRGPTEVSFHPGQRVRHGTFGEGTVESSRLVDGDEEVTIAFADRTRRLLASFAKLQVLE